jgi:hypothetical protein
MEKQWRLDNRIITQIGEKEYMWSYFFEDSDKSVSVISGRALVDKNNEITYLPWKARDNGFKTIQEAEDFLSKLPVWNKNVGN